MARPVDIRDLSTEALAALQAALGENLTQSEVQAAFEAAIAASEPIDVNVTGGSTAPFATKQKTCPAAAVTQLDALATPNGALIRATDDMFIYANGTPAADEGFIVYEGDDIRMTTVTNLNQVWVAPINPSAIDVYAMTL